MTGAGPGRAQFQPSYRRAAPWQASTLLSGAPLSDEETRQLLHRWGRLHAVRTILGGVAVMAFLLALGRR